ncbi:50S ribosomal protein [Actinidia chinensis var. chinensis]|uniref:Large ribosomal subunit protein bL9c n=1 Tax=Actinidia chinensis var. chinensis TaxID=1590841 RepID=A0A2R6RSH9_ACTCC|nr:50S ribosomal protein [Actinidia chinensis var. chinensis]
MAYIQYGRNILRHVKTMKNQTLLQSSDRVLHHPLLFAGQGVRYRKLEVILTTTIDKLGKAGETVKVAPGYFRNHLMPKLLAVPNIDKFAYLISEQRKIYQPKEVEEVKAVKKTDEDKMKEYQAAAKRLDGAKLVLKRFGNVDNELRSTVTKDDLLAEVARQLFVKIDPENLHLPTPLSSFGEFELPLRLPKSIPLPPGKVQWILNLKIRRK